MKILERRIYRGPNVYAHFPVIRLRVDLGELERWPSAKIPGFVDRLLDALPSLDHHTCSYGVHGGFIRRLREEEGTWLGHVLEHVAIELQVLAGAKVSFGKTRGAGAEGEYHVVFEYEEEQVGEAAGDLARDLLHALLPADLRPAGAAAPPEFDLRARLDELIAFAQKRQLGPSTASLVRAAQERDIPWLRLSTNSLIQFGHGRYQKRIQATITSETRYIAVEIASDKDMTNRILGDLGLPVPRQKMVRTAAQAVLAAEALGYPVVVKPLDANHGRGVSIDLATPEAVTAAFEKAAEHARTVLVETFLQGFDHRLLVVNGELIACAKRVPGHVVGDGERTITQLVELVNADPRRGIGHEKVLTRIELDYQARRLLELKGYTPDTVLAAGELMYLRSTGNLSTGGTAIDLTDVVHPDNREMAIRAAGAIGLDIAGIDFITPDISRSYREIGGGICEVNAAPGFRMHVAPTEGTPRDVAGPVMDMLFPPGTPSRIPIAAVTGTNGKTTVARMVAHIHKMCGATVGLSTTDGVYIDGERTVAGDMTGPVAAADGPPRPSRRPRRPRDRPRRPRPRWHGLSRLQRRRRPQRQRRPPRPRRHRHLEQLAEVKRIVVEVARDCAVLNADDERCLRMADYTEAKRIGYVTMNPKPRAGAPAHPRGRPQRCARGGHQRRHDHDLRQGHPHPAALDPPDPRHHRGQGGHNVQNAMFAALMAYAMGVKVENIRHGLRTFDTTYFQAPGRLNVFDELPFKVILDYGHNPAAVRAMASFVSKPRRQGPADLRARGPRRSPRRGHPSDRQDRRRLPPSTTSSCARTTAPAAASPTRSPR
jgi:cyanophycin synthetase